MAGSAERALILGRPVVTLTYAQSLDGALANLAGGRMALSGTQAQRLTHELRVAHDGILIGVGTVLSDDPQLSVRLVEGRNPQPIILDTHLRTPLQSRLVKRDTQPVWIAVGEQVGEAHRLPYLQRGVSLIACQVDKEGRIDLADLLSRLCQRGIMSLMVEGGAQVITSFLKQRMVDQVVITLAPIWLGGVASIQRDMTEKQEYGINLPQLVGGGMEDLGGDWVIYGKVRDGLYEALEPVFLRTLEGGTETK
jgi:riboflavin-specific deaminase-like protein